MKEFTVGERATSKVFLLYLADVANENVVKEMASRIESVKVDAILTTGELEDLLKIIPLLSFRNYQ